MLGYITRRLAYGAATLLALSAVVFFLVHAAGSPLTRLRANPRMAPLIPELTEYFGLDRSAVAQYLTWLRAFVTPDIDRSHIDGIAPIIVLAAAIAVTWVLASRTLLRSSHRRWRLWGLVAVWLITVTFVGGRVTVTFNWGMSFAGNGPVWDLVTGALGATVRLGIAALVIAVTVGVGLGIAQAMAPGSMIDRTGTVATFLTLSVPVFVVAVGLQVLLGVKFEQWTGVKPFFVAGMTGADYASLGPAISIGPVTVPSAAQIGDIVRHLTLPAATLSLVSMAQYARFQRSSLIDELDRDYVLAARAKGVSPWRIVRVHALRNAAIPVVTLISLDVAILVGGAVITESVFGWPGIGRLYLNAIDTLDYPVIMAVVMMVGFAIVLMNIAADLVIGVIDPRVRHD